MWEQGQCGLPLEEMPGYVQDVLDLIEWANGPADSTWGALRAAAGHPAPFGLQYLGLGNEEQITPVFRERFRLIYEVVQAKHPEITIVGTAGPRPEGDDYALGWQFGRELQLPLVDEHVYAPPDWFWENLERYDAYSRSGPHVYLGEYAAHDFGRRNTLRSALAEAAYMTALERNGDIVRLASYAPLLGKQKNMQWVPNLIYFDNTHVTPSINYDVQQLFSLNAGDAYLPADVRLGDDAKSVAFSCVLDTASGDMILKLVSRASQPILTTIDLGAAGALPPTAACTTLSGDPLAENEFNRPPLVVPQTAEIAVEPRFDYLIPAQSLSVIRIKIN
jgi:alpha-L-arabinofuranosidase